MKKKLFAFKIPLFLFCFMALFVACDSSSDDSPDAQIPRITSISSDVTTVVNVAKEISVGVEISDRGTLLYQWYVAESKLSVGEPVENAYSATFTPKTSEAGIYYYHCVITNCLGQSIRTVVSPLIAYTVTECVTALPPVILQQPQNVKQDFGKEFSFNVTAYSADGGKLSYQWYYKANKESEALMLDGATKATYGGTVSAQTLGQYYCAVTNTISDNGDGGAKSAVIQTNSANLSNDTIVANEPVILTQPADAELHVPEKATLAVSAYSADNGTLSYQWHKIIGATDTIIEGATKSSYELVAEMVGSIQYYCVVTNTIFDNGDGGAKSASINSTVATVTVTAVSARKPIIAQQPKDVTADFGTEFTLSAIGYPVDGGAVSYQWYFSAGETGEAVAIKDAIAPSYAGTVSADTTGYYYCIITNTIPNNGDGTEKTADTKTKTVKIASTQVVAKSPVILQQPQNIKQDFENTFSFSVTAYSADEGTLTYQWYYKTNKESEAKALDGATKTALVGSVSSQTIGYYYCVITNTISDNGDGGAKSATIQTNTACLSNDTIEANEPIILVQPENASLHVPGKKTLSVSAYSVDKGTLSYQWYKIIGDTDTAIEGATKSSYEAVAEAVGSIQYYCVVTNTISDNGDGGAKSATAKSDSVTVTVTVVQAQKPVIARQPEAQTATFGTGFSLSAVAYSADSGVLSYQWYFSATETGTSAALSGATKAIYENTIGTGTLGYYYCIITNTIADNGDGGGKTATVQTYTVKISSTQVKATTPVILQQPQNIKQNFGNSFAFSVTAYSADEGTLSYQWYCKTTEESTASAIEGATNTSYSGTVGSSTTGYYYCIITNTIANNGDGGLKTATIQTNTASLSNDKVEANAPVIFTKLEDVELHVPERTAFMVTAYSTDGGTLSYQWHKVTGDTDIVIVNATDASYEATATEVGEIQYYCVVTNTIPDNGDGGTKTASTKTNAATVTVIYANAKMPVITVQPDDTSAVIPAIKVFNVGAYTEDDGELTYQWYSVAEGEAEGTEITGETNPKLIVTVRELGKTGYYCVVTNTIADNGDGSGTKSASVKTNTAWLDAIYLKDVISAPAFTAQPAEVNVAPYNQSIKIPCTAEAAEGEVSYRWYESTDGTTATGVAVSNATTSTLTTPKFTERGIHYYYCVATTVLSGSDESVKSACAISNVVSVAYTGLPVVYIDTVEKKPVVSKTETVTASFKLVAAGLKKGYEDIMSDGIEIKCRGNSSFSGVYPYSSPMPKKSYSIKLSKKEKLLGMGKSKKWALIANYFDKTLLRCSYVSYLNKNVFTNLGWNPSYVHVDVVLNGNYVGNYTLAERIKIEDKRVNIQDISKVADINEGGFICEINERFDEDFNFRTTHGVSPHTGRHGVAISLKDPDEVSDDVKNKVQSIVQTAEDALFSENFADEENGYASYFDVDSLVDWYCLHEYIKMRDATVFFTSAYFYYNPSDKKIYMGPCWDYDTGAGNSTDAVNCQPEGFDLCTHAIWFMRLWEDDNFKEKVKLRWNEKYSDMSNSLAQIQNGAKEIKISADYNFMKWPVLGKQTGVNADGWENRTTYQSELDFMTEWLQKRAVWLNTEINNL